MEEKAKTETQKEEKKVIAPNLKEILDKAAKNKELTSAEIAILEEEAKQSTEFMKLIEEIQLPKENYVIFTDGEEQLVYENGEFFLVSTTDSTKTKKKKKRLEAKEMYIEYFIRYTLNRIQTKNRMPVKKEKQVTKEIKKEEVIQEEKKQETEKKMGREEEIKRSLQNMVKPVNEEFERNKIINKIKSSKQKSDKIR